MLTQRSAERDCVLDKIGYLWEALEDLQRGGNYGLKKPMDNLRDWVSQLGFTGYQGMAGRAGVAHADDKHHSKQYEKGGIPRETNHVTHEGDASYDKEWQKMQDKRNWEFPNSGLDGVDWLFNDTSWISASALNYVLLRSPS